MKIRLDDITYSIDVEEDGFWNQIYSDNRYGSNYRTILSQILTKNQLDKYTTIDTERTFTISEKKATLLMTLINPIS